MSFTIPRYLACTSTAANPLTLPGSASLESWHRADRGLTLSATLKRSPVTAPADITITSGSREQSIGLVFKITGTGGLGVSTYEAYLDGGVIPFQTGTTAASVLLVAVGLTLSLPALTYTVGDSYEGVVESWANLTPKSRLLSSVGLVSAKPTVLWRALNNNAVIRSPGGAGGFLENVGGDWASNLGSGTNKDFSVFLLCKTETAAPTSVRAWFAMGNTLDADTDWDIGIRNGTNNYVSTKVDDAGTGKTPNAGALDSNYHVVAVLARGATVDVRVDGATIMSGAAQNVGLSTFDTVCFFARHRGGVGGTNAMIGSIGEAVTYNIALTASDALTIENYLRAGWAL